MNFKIPFIPEQASTLARDVDHLTFALVGISTFFTVLIAAMVLVFVVRYRRRSPTRSARTSTTRRCSRSPGR